MLVNKVTFATDCIGSVVQKEIDDMHMGDVLLLENLRFHREEEENDSEFCKQLASLADVYVNDAFSNFTGSMLQLMVHQNFLILELPVLISKKKLNIFP